MSSTASRASHPLWVMSPGDSKQLPSLSSKLPSPVAAHLRAVSLCPWGPYPSVKSPWDLSAVGALTLPLDCKLLRVKNCSCSNILSSVDLLPGRTVREDFTSLPLFFPPCLSPFLPPSYPPSSFPLFFLITSERILVIT